MDKCKNHSDFQCSCNTCDTDADLDATRKQAYHDGYDDGTRDSDAQHQNDYTNGIRVGVNRTIEAILLIANIPVEDMDEARQGIERKIAELSAKESLIKENKQKEWTSPLDGVPDNDRDVLLSVRCPGNRNVWNVVAMHGGSDGSWLVSTPCGYERLDDGILVVKWRDL